MRIPKPNFILSLETWFFSQCASLPLLISLTDILPYKWPPPAYRRDKESFIASLIGLRLGIYFHGRCPFEIFRRIEIFRNISHLAVLENSGTHSIKNRAPVFHWTSIHLWSSKQRLQLSPVGTTPRQINLSSPGCSDALFFLLCEVFWEIWNAVTRVSFGEATLAWPTHSRIFSLFFCSRFFVRAESSLLCDKYSCWRLALSRASSPTGNRFFWENWSHLRGVLPTPHRSIATVTGHRFSF